MKKSMLSGRTVCRFQEPWTLGLMAACQSWKESPAKAPSWEDVSLVAYLVNEVLGNLPVEPSMLECIL